MVLDYRRNVTAIALTGTKRDPLATWMTVVRHCGFAAVFITPLTIPLAEAAMLGHESAGGLVEARFLTPF